MTPQRRAAVILAIVVASCTTDTTAPPSPTTIGAAHGHWTADGPDFIAAMDLSDTVVVATGNGIIKGSGTFTGPTISGGQSAFAVAGTDSAGVIHLALMANRWATAFFAGRLVADTQIVGALDSAGYNHLALTFSRNPTVASIKVTPSIDSQLPEATVQFVDSAFDLLGRPLQSPPVAWSTSDTALATISPAGLLKAKAPGGVQVSATYQRVTGKATESVLRPVDTVLVHPPALTFVVGATLPLTATLLDATGGEITGREIAWSSLNQTVAQVTRADSVKGVAIGTADIQATVVLDGRTGLAHMTVRTLQVTRLVAGAFHTCGIDADSSLACWGSGGNGELGTGLLTGAAAPLFVTGGLRFRAVAAGYEYTCGLAADSTAYCWGDNLVGQLGNGADGSDVPDSVPAPVSGGLKFASLVAAHAHSCGLLANGAAYCWGLNGYGELGNGSTSQTPITSPVAVSGGLTFTALAAGSLHTCGLGNDSLAYCWGNNDYGALGDSSTTSRSVPTAVAGGLKFVALATGAIHTCGITGAGAAYCWGSNFSGALGDSSGNPLQTTPVAVRASGLTFTAITAGSDHTCARATSGEIYCWGNSFTGQVGPMVPIGAVALVPTPVGLAGDAVAAGYEHTCALTSTGALCWGHNQFGQLGAASGVAQSAVPLRVSGQP
jgi:alpha-tubulin suppressor-like RCC1 family protein